MRVSIGPIGGRIVIGLPWIEDERTYFRLRLDMYVLQDNRFVFLKDIVTLLVYRCSRSTEKYPQITFITAVSCSCEYAWFIVQFPGDKD